MSGARVGRVIGHQELPAPNRSVRPPSGAIPGHANHRLAKPVFGHATRDVRVMVLDRDQSQTVASRPLPRVMRARVVRMEIANDGLRPDIE